MLVLASALMTSAISIAREASPVLQKLRGAVEQALEGKPEAVELALIALLARGHVLVEDVPGVGKTTLARALAKAVGGDLRRVQFTSDLLPSDVLGVSVYDQRLGEFMFRQGPIFTNVLLADEINRASPRTQSALLEAMNEGQVSVDGTTTPLPDPFFVIATQNPQDFAGTYPLPESQLDRFMVRIKIGYPPPAVEMRLLLHGGDYDRARHVPQVIDPAQLVALQREVDRVEFDASLATYLQAVLSSTRSSPTLSLGASPRAGMNLARAARGRAVLHGRNYCIADDVHDLTVAVLAHRVRLAAHAEGYVPSRDDCENAIRDLVARIPVPL
jgi:MoxR-like ATPase